MLDISNTRKLDESGGACKNTGKMMEVGTQARWMYLLGLLETGE